GGKNLLGIDPSDGKILFSIEHNGGNGTAVSPVPIGNDRFLLTIDDQYSKAFTVRQVGDGQLVASEDWQTRSIKNTYNVPVLSGDGVFAFSTRILTCVDPATGKALWKSRKPGDGFLIAVDGHLIISTKTGSIHLATASVEGYREKSKLKLFEDLVWSIPAYHDDSIFVRSMEEIARVDLVGKPKIAINNKLSLPMGNQFAEFLAEVKSLKTPAEKTKKINDWIQSKTSFPWIENDVAHFVYRGQPNDIALAGDFFGSRQEKSMIPVEGTDLFYYTVRLPLDQRANYCFLINYKPVADPLNPNQTTSSLYAGEMEFAIRLAGQPLLKMSSFAMPQWDGPDYLRDVANQLSGTVEDLILESKPDSEEPDNQEEADSEPATNPTKLKVYLPPNYAKNLNQRFPVAYIFDAKGAQQFGQMLSLVDNHFDRLIQQDSSIIPPILVLMDGLKPDFSNQIATEVVPFVDRNYRTRADRESRMIFGCGFYAGSSIITSLSENQTFGIAASQSPLAFAAERDMISKLVPKVDQATKVHLQWGRLDMFNPHENWDVRTMSQAVVQNLQSNDQIEVVGGPVNDSTDWSSWKNRYDEIFGLLIKF
ncbi:MAG: alpha/beta hydrolase-fold protein, partial [Planctomycetota bacterium]